MLPPLLPVTMQHGLNPLSTIRESMWESSLLEMSLSVLLKCTVHLLAEQTCFFSPVANNSDVIPDGITGERGGQGWVMELLQMRGWSFPSIVVSCHPYWEEDAVDPDGLSQNTGDAVVASSWLLNWLRF